MDDALLSYYNRELAYIRKLGAEFSEQHPKIAGRLRLDKDVVEDPHVSRLIESFAFLTARIRHTIDDNFPELTEALMGVLYPDYHTPFPSMSIVQFRVIPEVPTPQQVEQGRKIFTRTNGFGDCQFQTCAATDVLPLALSNARFSNMPVKAPRLQLENNEKVSPQSVLRLKITPFEGAKMPEFEYDSLRFYLNAQPQVAYKLLEYLLNNAIGVVAARDANDAEAISLPASALAASDLVHNPTESHTDGRVAHAYRRLVEYFVFPDKFLFVDLKGLKSCWETFPEGFSLYIYFDQTHPELVQGVDDSTLQLGCVPVINLFDDTVESIGAADVGTEVKLKVSSFNSDFADVHTIKSVYARNSRGEKLALTPFYGAHRRQRSDDPEVYWHMRRENSQHQKGVVSLGTDTYLSFVDTDFKVLDLESNWVINADVICTNRDIPGKLPFGPDQPKFDFDEGGAGMRIKCVSAPSSTIQPQLDSASRWQLITQLSLQSFVGQDGLMVLKQTLNLYDLLNTRETRAIIEGIVSLKTSITTARMVQQGRAAVCQGTKISLELDEQSYSGNSWYLFGSVLDEFFAQFCTINSFTQLSISIKQKPGSECEWPARFGMRQLA